MRFRPCLLVALLCAPVAALAQDASGERDSLLALLEEQTALATKTRLNADYVPGILSVLHGRDLELRGVRTVWEALALVPGIERAMEPNGRRKLLVRGVGNIWGSGNVKLLLNDVAMNTAERGIAEPLFNIPIEQVDRIEVVRGPGSAVHGEFAYLGVINVITHSDAPRVFAFGGSNATAGGGAVATWSEGDARVSASLSGWRTDGSKVRAGPDQLHAFGLPDQSHAPGYSNEALESGTGVLNLGYRGFSLLLQWNEDGLGDHFGVNNFLPPEDKHVVERNRHRTVEARHRASPGPALEADTFLGWQEVSLTTDMLYVGPDASPGGSEIFQKSRYTEQRVYAGADLTWQAHPQHTWLLGIQFSGIDVKDSQRRFNMDENGIATDEFVELEGVVKVERGTHRRISSLSLQDEYRTTDALTITAGARYDDYSDTGARLSPRLAGVWRLGDRHIVKAQYA
ncbi:MAG: TonB-dependent receptor plug domain-containing protein, partial [Thiohalomonadaceae bacterium]